jgi:formylglycine-generating enzyme required for sulfatase activity
MMPMAKKLFLLDQQISVLPFVSDEKQRRALVCGKAVARGEQKPSPEEEYLWLPNQRREVLARARAPGEKDWRRVAVVCDAGLGKTTNLAYLEAAIADAELKKTVPTAWHAAWQSVSGQPLPRSTQVGFRLELQNDDIPLHDRDDALLAHFADTMQKRIGGVMEFHLRGLKQLQKQGRLTMLLDGLDQAAALRVNVLKALLDSMQWCTCPIWIAGRPHAFDAYWPSVFADPAWQFLRVEPLSAPVVRVAWEHQTSLDFPETMPPGARQLLVTPRYLELVCGIVSRKAASAGAKGQDAAQAAETAVAGLQTVADVYYQACFTPGEPPASGVPDDLAGRGLLASGLLQASPTANIGAWQYAPLPEDYLPRIGHIANILGVVAFTMAELHPQAPFSTLVQGEAKVQRVKTAAAKKFVQAGLCETLVQFRTDYGHITRNMNVGALDYLLLSEDGKHALAWHDRTVQTFFAAYWAMKHGTDEDRQVLKEWIEDQHGERRLEPFGEFWEPTEYGLDRSLAWKKWLEEFAEFWELTAALPDEAVDKQKWLEVIGLCYESPPVKHKKQEWIKWSHRVLYHSWKKMQKRCPDMIGEYQRSYRALAKGTSDQRRIFRMIEEGFVMIPAGICPFGYDPGHSEGVDIPVQAFRLHRWAVSNEWYEEFEPKHERWIAVKDIETTWQERFGEAAKARCPVTVNWYEAWAFARWCGAELPDEVQWEYTCRGGLAAIKTAFWWGDNGNGTQCNCNGEHPYAVPETREPDKGPYLQGVVPVDGLDVQRERLYPPHPLGLEHMCGNVAEWTDSVDANSNERVLRGSSCLCYPCNCRSAYRARGSPADRGINTTGFRLSRTA